MATLIKFVNSSWDIAIAQATQVKLDRMVVKQSKATKCNQGTTAKVRKIVEGQQQSVKEQKTEVLDQEGSD